jgi:hypothetical protein
MIGRAKILSRRAKEWIRVPAVVALVLIYDGCASPKQTLRGSISSVCQQRCLNQGPTGQSPGDCLRECAEVPKEAAPQVAPLIVNPRSKNQSRESP